MYRNLSFVLPVIGKYYPLKLYKNFLIPFAIKGNRLRTAFNIGMVQKVSKSPLVDLPIFSNVHYPQIQGRTSLDPRSQVPKHKNPPEVKTPIKSIGIGNSPGPMQIFEAMGNHLTGCQFAKQYG